MMKIFKMPAFLAITVCIIFSAVSCSSFKDSVIAECNDLEINKSTFLLRMTDVALELYSDGENTADIRDEDIEDIKNKTIESLKAYTYYKQGYKELKYTLSKEDRIKLRSSILESLIALGLEYEESKKDKVFNDKFGVSYEQYMVYHEELALSEYYFNEKLEEIEVPEEKINEYFLKNKDKYMSCKADVVYIEDENPDETAEAIRNKFTAGESLKSIKAEFSQSINRSGTLVIDKTSNMDKYFGDGFIKEILNSSVNDVVVFKTENGVSIAKNLEITGYEENKEDIVNLVRKDIFAEMVKEETGSDNYKVTITNQKIYEEISDVP